MLRLDTLNFDIFRGSYALGKLFMSATTEVTEKLLILHLSDKFKAWINKIATILFFFDSLNVKIYLSKKIVLSIFRDSLRSIYRFYFAKPEISAIVSIERKREREREDNTFLLPSK